MTYILLYVDDIILTTYTDDLHKLIMMLLTFKFSMKNLGPLIYFVGIVVTRHTSGLFIYQKNYAKEIIDWANMSSSKPPYTHVDTKEKLNISLGIPYEDPTHYQSLVDAL